jgi:hypothetical protein
MERLWQLLWSATSDAARAERLMWDARGRRTLAEERERLLQTFAVTAIGGVTETRRVMGPESRAA